MAFDPADGWSLVAGQAIILITTISGFAYSLYRDARNRRWDLEDRARARIDQHAHLTEVVHKIDENTTISKDAFKEANDVNKKIAEAARIAAIAVALKKGEIP